MGRKYEKHDEDTNDRYSCTSWHWSFCVSVTGGREDPAAFCLYKWKGSDSAGWSYLNADGYAVTGWFEIGDQWYFLDENGSLLTNTVTPDGYRVDGSGAWAH